MFTSISINNFRCFRELSFENSLDRVSLIAGKNSVGKTTVLEAIYLLIGMGNPELTQRLSIFRGLSKFAGGHNSSARYSGSRFSTSWIPQMRLSSRGSWWRCPHSTAIY